MPSSRETHAEYRTLTVAFDGDGKVAARLEKLSATWTAKWPVEIRSEPDPGWTHARALPDMTRPT